MKSGDQCPRKCGGQLRVRTSKQLGHKYMQWLACNKCECEGGKIVVSESMVFKRNSPKKV